MFAPFRLHAHRDRIKKNRSGVSPSPGQCAPARACTPQHRNHPALRARPRGGLRLLDAGIVAVEAGEGEFQELGWGCCLIGAVLFERGAEGRKPRRVERCDGLARGRWQFSIHPLAQPTGIRGRNIRSKPREYRLGNRPETGVHTSSQNLQKNAKKPCATTATTCT